MTAWIVISVLVSLPMLARVPRVLSRLRVSREDPTRFEGRRFRRYSISPFTGYAGDIGKRGDAHVTGSITSTVEHHGMGAGPLVAPVAKVSGKTTTEVVVVDTFILTDGDGRVASFSVSGFDAQLGASHRVSTAALRKGKGDPATFLIYNHTTGRVFTNERPLRKMTFPFSRTYVGLVCLTGLGLPLALAFWICSIFQQRRFGLKGLAPLWDLLKTQAEALPRAHTTGGIPAGIEQLLALRKAGALSEREFTAAKAAILQSG